MEDFAVGWVIPRDSFISDLDDLDDEILDFLN